MKENIPYINRAVVWQKRKNTKPINICPNILKRPMLRVGTFPGATNCCDCTATVFLILRLDNTSPTIEIAKSNKRHCDDSYRNRNCCPVPQLFQSALWCHESFRRQRRHIPADPIIFLFSFPKFMASSAKPSVYDGSHTEKRSSKIEKFCIIKN